MYCKLNVKFTISNIPIFSKMGTNKQSFKIIISLNPSFSLLFLFGGGVKMLILRYFGNFRKKQCGYCYDLFV